jgi:flagellar FliJ protein
MKGFEFRYEQVLSLRIDQEKTIKDQLAKAIKELLMLESAMKQAVEDKLSFYNHVDELMKTGVNAAELQSFEGNKRYLRDFIIHLQQLIHKKQKEILDIRTRLLKATMEKKKLEKLKEKEYVVFQKEEQVADEKLTDQIVTFNSSLKKR